MIYRSLLLRNLHGFQITTIHVIREIYNVFFYVFQYLSYTFFFLVLPRLVDLTITFTHRATIPLRVLQSEISPLTVSIMTSQLSRGKDLGVGSVSGACLTGRWRQHGGIPVFPHVFARFVQDSYAQGFHHSLQDTETYIVLHVRYCPLFWNHLLTTIWECRQILVELASIQMIKILLSGSRFVTHRRTDRRTKKQRDTAIFRSVWVIRTACILFTPK